MPGIKAFQGIRGSSCWLAWGLVALLGGAQPARAQFSPYELVVVDFEIQAEGLEDTYLGRVSGITEKIFLDEVRSSPAIQGVRSAAVDGGLSEEEKWERARRFGTRFVIFGTYEVLGENVLVAARWMDLEKESSGSEEAYLGQEDLKDFDRIEKSIRTLGARVVQEMTAVEPPEGEGRKDELQVACFVGGDTLQLPVLDRFLTLELAELLGEGLAREGISPDRFGVAGMLFDEYRQRCEGRALRLGDERVRVLELVGADRRLRYRYSLEGTVLPLRRGIVVRSQLADRFGHGLVSLPEYRTQEDLLTADLPAALSEHLARPLAIYLVQDRLAELGYPPGKKNGELTEETVEALKRFQGETGHPQTGQLDTATLRSLGL